VVAISLEGSKILVWRKRGPSRIYAFALIILSGIASLGTSLQVVEKSKDSFLSLSPRDILTSPSYLAKEDELKSIDAEISTITSRIQALPADYTTATSKLVSYLSTLRDRKHEIIMSLANGEASVEGSHGDRTMITLLSGMLGLRPETLLLVLLFFVAASIEVGALLLTVHRHEDEQGEDTAVRLPRIPAALRSPSPGRSLRPSSSHTPPITPEAFLKAAKEGADLPFLHGRDTTAEKLGISYAEAKRLVVKLIQDGLVVVEGKRLRLAQVKGPAAPTHTTL
jgi:hypothetical protein